MKKTLIAVLVIILAVAGLIYFSGSIDEIVEEQIETHGSSALQTKVEVGGVKIKLLDGLGELTGFSVANPTGYSLESAIAFETVRLDIGTENITEMPIVIEEVLIGSVSTLYEVNAQGKGNLNVLLDQISSGTSGEVASADSGDSSSSESDDSAESDIRIVIKKLVIKDTQLALDLVALGQKKYDETLPTFAIENIGGSKGLPPAELGQAIGTSLLNKLIKEAKKKQGDKLKAKVKEKLMEELNEKGGEKLKGLLKGFGH